MIISTNVIYFFAYYLAGSKSQTHQILA